MIMIKVEKQAQLQAQLFQLQAQLSQLQAQLQALEPLIATMAVEALAALTSTLMRMIILGKPTHQLFQLQAQLQVQLSTTMVLEVLVASTLAVRSVRLNSTTLGLVGLEVTTMVCPWEGQWVKACPWVQACPWVVLCTITLELEVLVATTLAARSDLLKLIVEVLEVLTTTMALLIITGEVVEL